MSDLPSDTSRVHRQYFVQLRTSMAKNYGPHERVMFGDDLRKDEVVLMCDLALRLYAAGDLLMNDPCDGTKCLSRSIADALQGVVVDGEFCLQVKL